VSNSYDVVIIGCGPAGERAAIHAARAGRRVAVVEKAHVLGGTRINWGTIPSKTLRESALFVYSHTRNRLEGIRTEIADEITVSDFMHRERRVVQRELELVNQALGRHSIEVFQGRGRFVDQHTVEVLGSRGEPQRQLKGSVILIATGTTPNRPPDVPFDSLIVFDSDTILALPRMPRSMVVMGGGVIAVEYASIFAALGLEVTLLDTREELLPYLDREIADYLKADLERLGITIHHDRRYKTIERVYGESPGVRCRLKDGTKVEADVLLYSVGRDGNTWDIGLEAVGIEASPRGLIEVNEFYQTVVPNIYAAGDVVGYPALASTSMEQGRQAIRHAFGLPGPLGRAEILPFAIYAIPEVSFVGATEEELQSQGVDYVAGRAQYGFNPRGQIMGETRGMLKLLFATDDLHLLGAHLVGAQASELIHTAQAYMKSGATAIDIAEALWNYPTLSDLYRHAAMEALGEKMRRVPGWDPWPGESKPSGSGRRS
jgi:NAD(P) transhydrogenase